MAEEILDAGEPLNLDNQLCFALYVCSKEVIRRYKPLLDPLGLTYTSYITMLALWEQDGVQVKDLGKRLFLDSGTLTPLLKKMEKAHGFYFADRKGEGATKKMRRDSCKNGGLFALGKRQRAYYSGVSAQPDERADDEGRRGKIKNKHRGNLDEKIEGQFYEINMWYRRSSECGKVNYI